MDSKHPTVLSIAGSDSSAGAGIQADLKMCAAIGVHCATVITAVTAQNTREVQDVFTLPAEQVKAQAQAVLSDLSVKAIKIGMLGSAENVIAVSKILSDHPDIPVILDPVIVSSSGTRLLSAEAQALLISSLFPKILLLTPNLNEARLLLGLDGMKSNKLDDIGAQAKQLTKLGPSHILMKGGHSEQAVIVDALYTPEQQHLFEHPRIDSRNTHGTGCNLSSAIAAYLALGDNLVDATRKGIETTFDAISRAKEQKIGDGHGPLQP